MIEYDTVKEALQALIEIGNAKDIKVKEETIDFLNLQELYQERIYNLADLLNMSELYLTDKQGGNNVKRNAEKAVEITPEELATEVLSITKGLTLNDRDRDDYEKIRKIQLRRESEDSKNRYIANLELFLKDTMDRILNKEMTNDEKRDHFFNEYYGALNREGLELIESFERMKEYEEYE